METDKLAKCRICLVEDVRMYVVDSKNLQALYEKLTDVPFVTEDRRPMLACFFCCAKLKQCEQFQRKCLEAEELFAQIVNEDCELNSSKNHGHVKFYGGFVKTAVEHNAIKQELSDVCERQDIIEPEEEHLSQELDPKYVSHSNKDAKGMQPHNSTLNEPLNEFKTEMEEEEYKPIESDRIKNDEKFSHIHVSGNRFICDICKCDFSKNSLLRHIGKHCESPYKCEKCQRRFTRKYDMDEHARIHHVNKAVRKFICTLFLSIALIVCGFTLRW